MADDWRSYLRIGDLNYWRQRFGDLNYYPRSWYEHLDRWKYSLDNFGSYQGEYEEFLLYWQSHLNDLHRELSEQEQRINNVSNQLKNRQDVLTEKENQLKLMEERLNKMEFELKIREQRLERIEGENKKTSAAQKNFYASSNDDDDLQSPPVHSFDGIEQTQTATVNKTSTPIPKTSTSVQDEFNEMVNMTGSDYRQARQNFIKNRNIRAFSCTNFSARLRDPVPPPIFGETNEISEGDYWAVKIQGNMFAVFPNVKNYSGNCHYERAMGDVFDSNFIQGNIYKIVSVEQPAIFACDGMSWKLRKKGKLRLRVSE